MHGAHSKESSVFNGFKRESRKKTAFLANKTTPYFPNFFHSGAHPRVSATHFFYNQVFKKIKMKKDTNQPCSIIVLSALPNPNLSKKTISKNNKRDSGKRSSLPLSHNLSLSFCTYNDHVSFQPLCTRHLLSFVFKAFCWVVFGFLMPEALTLRDEQRR